MKQTAVEWFEIELKDNLGKIVINQNWQLLEELINEAKEMEKEQIKDAWYNSLTKADYNSADEYYNETFNKVLNIK